MQFYYNFELIDWYDTDKNATLTFDIPLFCEMTYNFAETYVQFLPRLCNTYNMYIRYILNSVSVNLMNIICSGDDIERVCVYCLCLRKRNWNKRS